MMIGLQKIWWTIFCLDSFFISRWIVVFEGDIVWLQHLENPFELLYNTIIRYNKNYDTKVITIHICYLQINGAGLEELPNGDCQKSTTKSLTQQNKSLSSSTATSTSNKGVTSNDSDLHSTNTNDKASLQNGSPAQVDGCAHEPRLQMWM